jgi:signal transduction histidine kinase
VSVADRIVDRRLRLNHSALQIQWARSDRAAVPIRSSADPVVPTASLDALAVLRARVLSRQVSLADAVDSYSSVIVSAEGRRAASLSEAVPDPRVIRQDEINKQLTDLAETFEVSDALSFSAFSPQGMTSDALQRYARQTGDFLTLLTTLQRSLPPPEAAKLNQLTAGPDGEVVAVIQRSILRGGLTRSVAEASEQTKPGPSLPTSRDAADPGLRVGEAQMWASLPVPRQEWRAATARIASGLVDLKREHLSYAAMIARDTGQQKMSSALAGSVVLLAFAILVLAGSLMVSRTLIGRLRRLREETIDLSRTRLPDIVERLRGGEQVDLTGELPSLDYGSDEIGQVADAFGEAQRTAVMAAARETETRAGFRKVFLDIAHRSQTIVYRQLKVLDKAERNQEDPDQLELLFQLDHLATRTRRNAENLIILGGGQAGRRWRGPVPLLQLIRSAISEAEHFARVTVTTVPEVTVVGGAAADLIHLLAELVDNATSFSPPATGVEVRGNLVGRGLVIEIEDQGLGIHPDQIDGLNDMLHNPPDFQVMALAVESRLGLFVVAQLAARRGIRVTLTASDAYGGTKAVVLVPATLLLGEPQPGGAGELPASPGARGTTAVTASAPHRMPHQPSERGDPA